MIIGMTAARRLMRQHQQIPPRRPRLPLWRLLLGEAAWALRQLVRRGAAVRTAAAELVVGVVLLALLVWLVALAWSLLV